MKKIIVTIILLGISQLTFAANMPSTAIANNAYPNLSGVWVLEAHLNDGRTGVQYVKLEQASTHLTGMTFYLVDPGTGEKNPKKADSLSKITGSVLPNKAFPIVTLTRLQAKKSFVAVFTGNYVKSNNKAEIRGYFVNTANRSGHYTMVRAAQSPYFKLVKRAESGSLASIVK